MSLQPRLIDGVLYVPARAETDGVIGDGMLPLMPGDPEYAEWLEQLAPEELQAAGWDEGEHPRWPAGSERGGEFAPKDAGEATEARLGPQADGTVRISKAPNLQEFVVLNVHENPWLEDVYLNWPNLTAEQGAKLRDWLSSPETKAALEVRGRGKIRQEAKWVLRDLGGPADVPVQVLPQQPKENGPVRSLLDKLDIGGGRAGTAMLEAARTVDRTIRWPEVPGEPRVEMKGVAGGRSRQAAFWRTRAHVPYAITVAASGVNPISSTVHELGHYLDSALGQDGLQSAMLWNDYSSMQGGGTLQPVIDAIKQTAMYHYLNEYAAGRGTNVQGGTGFSYGGRSFAPGRPHVRYLMRHPELIARSFEQYIASKNPGSKLANTNRHAFSDGFFPPEYPGYLHRQDLEHVNAAWDQVLTQRGLLKKPVKEQGRMAASAL